jgi:hypothetical protein
MNRDISSFEVSTKNRLPKSGRTQPFLTGFLIGKINCRVARRAAGAAAGGAQMKEGGGGTFNFFSIQCVPALPSARAVPSDLFLEFKSY